MSSSQCIYCIPSILLEPDEFISYPKYICTSCPRTNNSQDPSLRPSTTELNILDILPLHPDDAIQKLNEVSDIYTRLSLTTSYLQHLADNRMLILSTAHRYYELYYYPEEVEKRFEVNSDDEEIEESDNTRKTRIISSCWSRGHKYATAEETKRFANPQDYIYKTLIPERKASSEEKLCHYWFSFTDGDYAISTLFHIEDLD